MAHILVLEDDLALSAGLCFELDACGHLTVAAYHCEKARQLLEKEAFDLALFDGPVERQRELVLVRRAVARDGGQDEPAFPAFGSRFKIFGHFLLAGFLHASLRVARDSHLFVGAGL